MEKKVKCVRYGVHRWEFESAALALVSDGWEIEGYKPVEVVLDSVEAPRRGRPPKVRD